MDLKVETVAAPGFELLAAVRRTIAHSSEVLLCVAFVHERGVRLLESELKQAAQVGRVRLLVTTVFDRGGASAAALSVASAAGAEVQVHNRASGTYHPKLYLGRSDASSRAVIGSANLTSGLATNVEVGVSLEGRSSDAALARAWDIGEQLWADARSEQWLPSAADGPGEVILPAVLAALEEEVRSDPVFLTLGPRPVQNRVLDITPTEVLIETERSRRNSAGPQPVPAWMLNLAWEVLTERGELTNTQLLEKLRVHRSSAVCALLARIPGVRVDKGRRIRLRWTPTTRGFAP